MHRAEGQQRRLSRVGAEPKTSLQDEPRAWGGFRVRLLPGYAGTSYDHGEVPAVEHMTQSSAVADGKCGEAAVLDPGSPLILLPALPAPGTPRAQRSPKLFITLNSEGRKHQQHAQE